MTRGVIIEFYYFVCEKKSTKCEKKSTKYISH